MFNVQDQVHGFCCTHSEYVEEVKSNCYLFEHVKTKASVLVMGTSDDDKVFCTYFPTPPTDDTGVPHILEHSVLNGSRKYPVKEPFVELIKASLYTFLNAMTYDDKTVYPISSRNDQDFHNLMDVYLDAVYFPNLTEQTFMQEGWHYEIDSPDSELEFSGVVYNEMLGATSSPESVLYDQLDKHLFPNSTYSCNSGGDPEAIPNLTYEGFVNFHKKHYHPSNSRTILYGDFDVADRLKHLAEYFDSFDYQEPDSQIRKPEAFTEAVSCRETYPVTPGSDTSSKCYVVRSWLLGSPMDPEFNLSANILSHILAGTPASPLRKAAIESQLGEQTIQWFSGESIVGNYTFGLKGTDESKAEEIERLIDTTLQNLASNGIDPRTVEAAINSTEFKLREANYGGYSKGLIYALNTAASWLYGGDPLTLLRYEEPLAAIKKGVAEGQYFEKLIQDYLIDNKHQLTLVMVPDEEHEARRLERLAKRMEAIKNGLTGPEVEALIKQAAELRAAQLEPDSPEALATIPKLPLSCIDRNAEELPIEAVDAGPKLLFSNQPTSGISYLKLSFDAKGVSMDLLPYLPLFCQIIMQSGTKNRDYVELMQEIGIQTGGISAGYSARNIWQQPEQVYSAVTCNAKALTAKTPEMLKLLTEIVSSAKLEDTQRVLEIARTAKSNMESSINNGGSRFATTRMEAVHSLVGKYNEQTSGLEQYSFLLRFLDRLEKAPEQVTVDLIRIRDILFQRGNLIVHLTGEQSELDALRAELPKLVNVLPDGESDAVPLSFPETRANEALIIPSKVQYACKGLNFIQAGQPYEGHAAVLTKLLSSDYLWNKVRVQGNAYGCFCSFSMLSGVFHCCSYRDPNLKETYEVFDTIADYLEELDLPREEFEKALIGTMGKIDAPRTPSQKGSAALNRYLIGVSQQTIQEQREQVLDCTLEDIKAYAKIFHKFAEQGTVCAVGGEEKIRSEASLFDTVRTVFS